MAEETKDGSHLRYVAVKCLSCDRQFRVRKWSEGMSCPECRATDVQPLPVPGGAVDYLLADRSQGTTRADVAFGEWARWCGFITANQYNTAVHRQTSQIQDGGSSAPIHEILIGMKALDEERAVGLLRFMTVRRPNADDEDLMSRLLATGKVDPQKVAACRTEQAALAKERNEVPFIGQLLLRRRVVDEETLVRILHEEDHERHGALHMARMMSTPPPKDTPLAKLARRTAKSPRLVRNAVVLAVLTAVVVAVWAYNLSETEQVTYGQCETCGFQQEVTWSATDWPATCSRCRKKTVMLLVKCPNGHIYTRLSPFSRSQCPVCKSGQARPLTAEEFKEFTSAGR
jgi:hypothetical protein